MAKSMVPTSFKSNSPWYSKAKYRHDRGNVGLQLPSHSTQRVGSSPVPTKPLSVTTLAQLWNFSSCVSLNLLHITSVVKILHVSRQQRNCHCARKRDSLWEFFCASVMWIYLPTVFKTMCFPRLNTVWILESKTKSKSVFPLWLQDIGQPLILPFQRCYRTNVNYLLLWKLAIPHLARTQWCLCLAFLKLSFTALAWGILKICSWRRLSSQTWVKDGGISWLSLPFVSLRHWGTDVSVILGWINNRYVLGWARLRCYAAENRMPSREEMGDFGFFVPRLLIRIADMAVRWE